MPKLICALLFGLVAIINLLPVVGVVSRLRLQQLYRVELSDPNLAIMMQHRAILFGVVGGLLMAAVWLPWLRWPAAMAGFVSMVSFVVLAAVIGGYNEKLRVVVLVDYVGIVLLCGAILLHWMDV